MTAHAVRLQDEAPRRLLSVADLDRMIEAGIIDEDEKVELIDGELIVMAAKKFAHELIKSSLVRLFIQASPNDVFVGIEASIRLDTHTLVEPDILLCSRDRLVVSPEGYLATPATELLLVVEVADSTLRKDRVLKAALYARHGVPEYWIVDTNKRVIWRHRGPELRGYARIETVREVETLSPEAAMLAAVQVRLADLS